MTQTIITDKHNIFSDWWWPRYISFANQWFSNQQFLIHSLVIFVFHHEKKSRNCLNKVPANWWVTPQQAFHTLSQQCYCYAEWKYWLIFVNNNKEWYHRAVNHINRFSARSRVHCYAAVFHRNIDAGRLIISWITFLVRQHIFHSIHTLTVSLTSFYWRLQDRAAVWRRPPKSTY